MKKKPKTYAQGYARAQQTNAQLKNKKGAQYEKWKAGLLLYAARLAREKKHGK